MQCIHQVLWFSVYSLSNLRSLGPTLIQDCLLFEGRPPANKRRRHADMLISCGRHDVYLVIYILALDLAILKMCLFSIKYHHAAFIYGW